MTAPLENRTMKVQACACGLLLTAALTVNAGERLTIAVSPLQSFAPTNLTVRIHVEPDVDNPHSKSQPSPASTFAAV
jgi:hypothetical protein